jgi:hypothetical protein
MIALKLRTTTTNWLKKTGKIWRRNGGLLFFLKKQKKDDLGRKGSRYRLPFGVCDVLIEERSVVGSGSRNP